MRRVSLAILVAVHSGDGKVVVLEAIFGGKTERSLPSQGVRSAHPLVHCAVSPSHWATEATKLALAGEIFSRTQEKLVAGGMPAADAATAQRVWWLDCWKVNIKASFRAAVDRHWPEAPAVARMERFAFYERARQAFAVVMTGETVKYGNIIIKKGVIPIANQGR